MARCLNAVNVIAQLCRASADDKPAFDVQNDDAVPFSLCDFQADVPCFSVPLPRGFEAAWPCFSIVTAPGANRARL